MNIWDYIRVISESSKSEWLHTVCWGYGSCGCFHDDLSNETIEDQMSTIIDKHSNYATFANDVSISLAWGLGRENKELVESWTKVFPPKSSRMYFLDFFYNNALIYRENVVSVDGGRCILPLPKQVFDKKDETKIIEFRVNSKINRILKLINSLQTTYDYDSYITKTKIVVIDGDYPILKV